jgi:hypothetical protein
VKKRALKALILALVLTAAVGTWAVLAQAGGKDGGKSVRGAGTTIIVGGTGPSSVTPPPFTPLLTKVGFNWSEGQGSFDCLALAPSAATGAGSGDFKTNVMYVTGAVTSVSVQGRTAVLEGTANVTGVGAGTDQPYTLTVTRGGPGASLVLVVSGLTFRETLLEGAINF